MPLSGSDADAINGALGAWRQGDVTLDEGLEFLHLGDLMRPGTDAAEQAAAALLEAEESVPDGPVPLVDGAVHGFAMLSQTCDIVRDCRNRPYVEVAPLIEVSVEQVEAARRLKLPALAYIPTLADRRLVAHIDRVMTVEKSLAARWGRVAGWERDEDARAFAQALARKRARFAFPDDFAEAVQKLSDRLTGKHDRQSDEGAYLRALWQIRVRAAPSWDDETVTLEWWFIKMNDPAGVKKVDWNAVIDGWMALFEPGGRYTVMSALACKLEDLTGRDVVESDVLDFDRLSTPRSI